VNDLDLIRRFRAGVRPPDKRRVGAARARLIGELGPADAPPARSGSRLHGRGWPRHRRRPALTVSLGLLAAASLAAAILAVVVLVAGGVGGAGTGAADAAVIRHVNAAFTAPPNEIFHFRLQGNGFVAESWQLTSPPYSYLEGKGPIGADPYASDDGVTAAYYDPATNTIHHTSSTKPAAPDNPLTEIKQDLRDGRARLLRAATLDGTATYAIQLADKHGFDAQSLVAYVDRRSYRPIEIVDPQRNGTTVDLRVVAFDYLPATPANMRLLSLTAHYPNARVVHDSGPAGTTSAK
jgi:hypothetical protein